MADSVALRDDAAAIRDAAIAAVEPAALVARRCTVAAGLLVDGMPLDPACDIEAAGRIAVVGGGKAAAGMAAGVERLLLGAGVGRERLAGLVSVPEGCGANLTCIEVRQTRPAGRNLPTPEAVAATREMLGRLGSLGARDLAIAIITGGGSALIAAPRAGVPLGEKIAVTGFLSAAGADIRALNSVRQAVSDVKAGGLARASGAGRLLALVLSDVIGDPLDSIASGPCMPVAASSALALDLLEQYGAIAAGIAPRLVNVLRADLQGELAGCDEPPRLAAIPSSWTTPRGCHVDHIVLGSNATAVEAAAAAARNLGYEVTLRHGRADRAESAEAVGTRLAAEAFDLDAVVCGDGRARAVIEGGEATVRLPADHGRGGRNQQTVLAALMAGERSWPAGLLLESVGTDGEDGPTDAAGGFVDTGVWQATRDRRLDVAAAVARCDGYPLLDAAGGLIRTGPTGTNVADFRVLLARP